jgi:hypothetical protein
MRKLLVFRVSARALAAVCAHEAKAAAISDKTGNELKA